MQKRRSTSNPLFGSSRHPFFRLGHPTQWTLIAVAALFLVLIGAVPALPAEQAGATPRKEAATDPAQQKKQRHENDFVLFGTVFTEEGFALPGARIRVRRASERKVRWEGRSDSRGEFAVRMPQGVEYEMNISARGFQEQTQKVDARSGNRVDLVFRLASTAGGRSR